MPAVADLSLILELETRQDDVLRQLDELNARLERTIADCAGPAKPATLPFPQAVAVFPPAKAA